MSEAFVSSLHCYRSMSILADAGAQLNKIEDKAERGAAENRLNSVLSQLSKDPSAALLGSNSVADEIIFNISSSVIRIGAVLIGIFLIKIMVTFARYYYKLAEHLSMGAALISLSGGRVAELKVIVPLLLPSKIDFGKAPKLTLARLRPLRWKMSSTVHLE
jgi:hypothetical protein